jgi:hypothetical protein
MRREAWLASAFVCFLLAAPGWAQVVSFGNVNPTQIVNQPVILPSTPSSAPIASPQQNPSTGFSLAHFFSSFSLPGAQPVHGQSVFPTQDKMPGKDYLKAFGFQHGQPIKP